MATLRDASPVTSIPVELAAFIEDERRRADVVGTVVAAFGVEGLRFVGCFGHADLGRAEPVTADTRFRAASITKLFTACLVLQEIADGRFALDDPVNHHLDQRAFVRDERGALDGDVTLRRLLTHTSGLRASARGFDYGHALLNYLANGFKVPKTLAEVVANQRTKYPPGTRFADANGAFNVLGYLAEHAHKTPFAELLRQRILEPLGMQRSSVEVAVRGPGVATPYGSWAKAGRKPALDIQIHAGPASGLVTTAPDLARFGTAVLRGGEIDGTRILAEDLLKDATKMQVSAHPSVDHGVGFGFGIRTFRGHGTLTHGGNQPGVATRIALLPEDKLGVLALSNGGDPSYVQRVVDRTIENLLGIGQELIPGAPAGVPAAKAQEWAAFTRRIVGRYRLADKYPPGILAGLMGLAAPPRLAHVAESVLALECGGRVVFLHPDGDVGCYRASDSANRATVEERDGQLHLWVLEAHFVRRV